MWLKCPGICLYHFSFHHQCESSFFPQFSPILGSYFCQTDGLDFCLLLAVLLGYSWNIIDCMYFVCKLTSFNMNRHPPNHHYILTSNNHQIYHPWKFPCAAPLLSASLSLPVPYCSLSLICLILLLITLHFLEFIWMELYSMCFFFHLASFTQHSNYKSHSCCWL